MTEPTCIFCDDTLRPQYYTPETQVCDNCAHEMTVCVLDACVTSWVPTDKKTPKELLRALLMADQRVALDPLVSEEARKLQLDERAKIVSWLRERTGKHPFVMQRVIAELADGKYEEKL